MDIRFIGQGLNGNQDISTGNIIIETLQDEEFISFHAFVAFLSLSGINNLLTELNSFKDRGGQIKLFIGVDLNGTSKEALEKLMELNIETYIVHSPNNVIYHPKIYVFEGQNLHRAIIGSSNMTERGLFQSMEASTYLTFNKAEDAQGVEFMNSIFTYYNTLLNNNNPSTRLLNQEILDVLVNSKVVLSEQISRAKHNKINKEFQERDVNAYSQLVEKFRKLSVKRPPAGYKRVISSAEVVVSPGVATRVVSQDLELTGGSMWIETRRMTGGSMNQLDMSKRGRLNGQVLIGSISYFGIDADDTHVVKTINVILGDKQYNNNTILYTPANSNWRIQLNGVTVNGERLTDIARTTLGTDGGFVNRVLLFTHIENDNYKLEVLDPMDLPQLIENSNLWGKMGNEATGRSYGFI